MKKTALFIFMLMTPGFIAAQGFMEPLESFTFARLYNHACVVTDPYGQEVSGIFRGAAFTNGKLDRITIQLEDETKIKYRPHEFVRLRIENKNVGKLQMKIDTAKVKKGIALLSLSDSILTDYIVYERVHDLRNNDYQILQLLNPDFSTRIKVYSVRKKSYNSGSVNGWSIEIDGSDSFLFVKDGVSFFGVKKKNYKKRFYQLYGDCPLLVSAIQNSSLRWKEVAWDVFAYNQVCPQ